ADDLNWHAEVHHHASDDGELLEVLLAEDRDIGLDDVEELRDDRAHALEVTRAELTIEDARESRHLDARRALCAVGIDLVDVGHEHQAAAGAGEHALILARSAWVLCPVLIRPELHRVDEDARDEAVAVAARRLDEAHVPSVKIPHGRDEGDAQPLT